MLARALVKPLIAIEWPNDLEAPAPEAGRGAGERPRPLSSPANEPSEAPERSGASVAFDRNLYAYRGVRPIFLQNMVFSVDAVLRPPLHSKLPDHSGSRP